MLLSSAIWLLTKKFNDKLYSWAIVLVALLTNLMLYTYVMLSFVTAIYHTFHTCIGCTDCEYKQFLGVLRDACILMGQLEQRPYYVQVLCIVRFLWSTGHLQNCHPQNFIGKNLTCINRRAGYTWMTTFDTCKDDGMFPPYQLLLLLRWSPKCPPPFWG